MQQMQFDLQGQDYTGQSDIVIVIFAPLPALSRVHGKVQGQQLML